MKNFLIVIIFCTIITPSIYSMLALVPRSARIENNSSKVIQAAFIRNNETTIEPINIREVKNIQTDHIELITDSHIKYITTREIWTVPWSFKMCRYEFNTNTKEWIQNTGETQSIPWANRNYFVDKNGKVTIYPLLEDYSKVESHMILQPRSFTHESPKQQTLPAIKRIYEELSLKLNPDLHNNSSEVIKIHAAVLAAYKKLVSN